MFIFAGISAEDLASGELSLETTVPTDLTVSQSESDENGHSTRFRGNVTKSELQKKQMSHDIQLLKIELSQKSMIIDNMKLEHMSSVEELEEKLNEVLHQKKITQTMLENQVRLMNEEMKLKERKFDSELKLLLEKQEQLENVNLNYCETAEEVKRSLDTLQLTDSEYTSLKARDEKLLSIKQYAAVCKISFFNDCFNVQIVQLLFMYSTLSNLIQLRDCALLKICLR